MTADVRPTLDQIRVPVTASGPTHVPHALHLQLANVNADTEGLRQVKGGKSSDAELVGTWALEYEQSALGGDDVASFFRSLDDNCVWHLHHLDQVICLESCFEWAVTLH